MDLDNSSIIVSAASGAKDLYLTRLGMRRLAAGVCIAKVSFVAADTINESDGPKFIFRWIRRKMNFGPSDISVVVVRVQPRATTLLMRQIDLCARRFADCGAGSAFLCTHLATRLVARFATRGAFQTQFLANRADLFGQLGIGFMQGRTNETQVVAGHAQLGAFRTIRLAAFGAILAFGGALGTRFDAGRDRLTDGRLGGGFCFLRL
jgi:hypothetical protein